MFVGENNNVLSTKKFFKYYFCLFIRTMSYQSGEISKALELCFQHRQFDALHQIAEDLSEDSSSEMTKRVADYFMEHGHFDKAMEILVKSKKIGEALELCMAHNITLTEELVERMTIPKKPNGECGQINNND